ncbi:MAG: hypothetical protein JTT11_07685 [Candidatus Brockarchaeota archaeon]|nr:hypothetical protein [Candidatus Brockarchaeota archaeon]
MRISPLAEVVIKDLDDLAKSASGLYWIPIIGGSAYPPRPWYIMYQRFLRDRYGTYEKSRNRLYVLLQLERWNRLERGMALWEAVKVAYGRDFLDKLQEQKEREMTVLTQNVRIFMKKIGEVLLEYKDLFGLKSDGSPVRPEAEAYITQILSHPSEEYRSYYGGYENLTEDVVKRIRDLRKIRVKTLEIFRQTSPELCERIESTERDLFETIKLTDQQERLEPVDLRLIDSVLKCVCTHVPRCYEEGANSKDPVEFARRALSCPNVAEIFGINPRWKGKAASLVLSRLGRFVDALISLYCDYYIPFKHKKAMEGMVEFGKFEEETMDERASMANLKP